MMGRRTLGVMVALAVLGAAPGAAAQEPMERAAAALQAGDHATAIRLYREVLVAQPDNAPARFGLGQALYTVGEVSEAVRHLEAARDASGGAPIVQYVLGQAYYELERYGAADAALGVAATARPDAVPLAFLRAELCYRLGRPEATERRLDAVVALAPDWDVPPLRRGTLRLDLSDYDGAVAPLARAHRLAPANVDAGLLLAVAYSRTELPERSLEVLERLVEAAPDSIPALLALAERYATLSRSDDVRRVANSILELAPGHPVAEYRLANQAHITGDLEAAQRHADRAARGFRTVAAQGPAGELLPEVMRLLADVHARLGDTARALTGARGLVAEFPRYANGHFLLGNLLLRSGDTTGRDHLRRFKSLTDARTHFDLATQLLNTKHYEEAAAELETALALRSANSAARDRRWSY